jgi:thiol:disulfide interchange protein DsbC
MNPSSRVIAALVCAAGLAALALPASADEAAIRKSLGERVPDLLPKVDEISKTPMAGVYEIRIGVDVFFYTDEHGSYLVEGHLIDPKTRVDLTEQKIAKLTAIDFKTLPLKDAIVWKQGTGERKLVVFADPNCGYCKKFEKDLQAVKDVTVYTFLYPILGGDSPQKSQAIWCAKDSTRIWRDWMIKGTAIPESPQCDTSALQRNVALGRKYRINGTPGLVFEDGKHQPGAASAEVVEKQLAISRSKSQG